MFSSAQQSLARRILFTKWSQWNSISDINISTSAISCADLNHYDALGIPQSSTQRDIKAAYYKLSMQYHPDKNQGCAVSAQKFREISKAYEVLGNYKLRRLYDKGVGAGVGVIDDVPHHAEPVPEDDDETKFYKSRFRKSTVTMEGRTPIYDFDEWSRAHYGKTFVRRQTAQKKYERKVNEKQRAVTSLQNEVLLFGGAFVLISIILIFRQETHYDTPKERTQHDSNKNKK